MSWASGDDVVAITGEEATSKAVALANVMIEIFSGTTTVASDDGLISSRNLRYLKQAAAFQAVWLDAHPDVLETMDVEGVSQDGLNATYANVNAHLLAPMASRCLNRLSWRAQINARRSSRIASVRGNRDSAVRDDQYEWSPMPFGTTGH
jgi:hypothetical protein